MFLPPQNVTVTIGGHKAAHVTITDSVSVVLTSLVVHVTDVLQDTTDTQNALVSYSQNGCIEWLL
jgi:hypothetical protein